MATTVGFLSGVALFAVQSLVPHGDVAGRHDEVIELRFEGNVLASDRRLRCVIRCMETKSEGFVKAAQDDVARLIEMYQGLGFKRVSVVLDLSISRDRPLRRQVRVTYFIDEGVRQ